MRLRYARLSTTGPVRAINEDWLDFWESPDPLVREQQGSVALLADGVGGYERGEVASRLAVDEALQEFQAADRRRQALRPAAPDVRARPARASTRRPAPRSAASRWRRPSCVSIFRNRTVCVANVGDTRAYFIRQKDDQAPDDRPRGHGPAGEARA